MRRDCDRLIWYWGLGLLGLVLFVSVPAGRAEGPPVIVIDPGHGGNRVAGSLEERSNSSPNNAKSPGGILEKDITLEFSRILQEAILEAASSGPPVGVIMTRLDDVNLNFKERAASANHPDTACVVSIHFNAGGGGRARGSLALISAEARNPHYETDRSFGEGLAEACASGVGKVMSGAKNRGIMTDEHLHGGLGSNFFFQMARHEGLRSIPKCFLEVEFIDNPEVERELLQGDRAGKFRVIAASIAAYLVSYVRQN